MRRRRHWHRFHSIVTDSGCWGPDRLPGVDERVDHELLAKIARKCVALRRAEDIASWVGPGRAVTAKRVLRRADLPEVGCALGIDLPPRVRSTGDVPDLHTPWITALSGSLLSIRGKQVIPGPAAGSWPSIADEGLLDLWLRALAGCLRDVFPDDSDGAESLEVGRVVLTALAAAERARGGADLLGAIDRMILDSSMSLYRTFDQDLGFQASVQVALDLLVAFGAAAPKGRGHRITPLARTGSPDRRARAQLHDDRKSPATGDPHSRQVQSTRLAC